MIQQQRNGSSATLEFEAIDVTGMRLLEVSDVQRTTPAGAVATALSERMSLPANVEWMLRDSRSRVLDDAKPIGDQIQAGERLTVTTKARLV